jgi:hypothetical protein
MELKLAATIARTLMLSVGRTFLALAKIRRSRKEASEADAEPASMPLVSRVHC